jgi:hypothetical protein
MSLEPWWLTHATESHVTRRSMASRASMSIGSAASRRKVMTRGKLSGFSSRSKAAPYVASTGRTQRTLTGIETPRTPGSARAVRI